MQLLTTACSTGALEDDALLEAVVLLGALAGRPEYDAAIADSQLVGLGLQLHQYICYICVGSYYTVGLLTITSTSSPGLFADVR